MFYFRLKRILKKIFASENILTISAAFLLLIYFIYHTINGDRGLLESFKLKKELNEKAKYLEEIAQEREMLEKKIQLLKPDSVDLDLLDEMARRDLGLIEKNESVIYPKK